MDSKVELGEWPLIIFFIFFIQLEILDKFGFCFVRTNGGYIKEL